MESSKGLGAGKVDFATPGAQLDVNEWGVKWIEYALGKKDDRSSDIWNQLGRDVMHVVCFHFVGFFF